VQNRQKKNATELGAKSLLREEKKNSPNCDGKERVHLLVMGKRGDDRECPLRRRKETCGNSARRRSDPHSEEGGASSSLLQRSKTSTRMDMKGGKRGLRLLTQKKKTNFFRRRVLGSVCAGKNKALKREGKETFHGDLKGAKRKEKK